MAMSDKPKLGELGGFWEMLFKVRQISGVVMVPLGIALITVVVIPWCRGMDSSVIQLHTQMMLIEQSLPILKDVESRQRDVIDRVTKLEGFANVGPRFTIRDAEALENRIMLALQKEQQTRFDVLLNRLDTLTEAINQLKVEMAAAGHLGEP